MQNGLITTQLIPHNRLYSVPTSKNLIPPSKAGKTRGQLVGSQVCRLGGGGGGLHAGAVVQGTAQRARGVAGRLQHEADILQLVAAADDVCPVSLVSCISDRVKHRPVSILRATHAPEGAIATFALPYFPPSGNELPSCTKGESDGVAVGRACVQCVLPCNEGTGSTPKAPPCIPRSATGTATTPARSYQPLYAIIYHATLQKPPSI